MYIYSEEELGKKIDLLNALSSQYFPWQYTTARKDHEDLFGVVIKERQAYFKRQCGQAWDDVIKMSRNSMDKFIYALFNGDFYLQELAKYLQNKKLEERREAFKKLKI